MTLPNILSTICYIVILIFIVVTDFMIFGGLLRTPFYMIGILYPIVSAILLILNSKKIINYLNQKFTDIYE